MITHTGIRIGLALTLVTAAIAAPARAQDTTASADSGNTYVTLDGYGLGKIIEGSITDVTIRARAAMVRMKIVEEPARSHSRGWRELWGKKGDLDVSIRLKSQSTGRTRVEVNARAGLTGWDKGLAQQVLDEVGKT
jgi:hypothetical protein